jgi:hypothetical protein
MRHGSEAPKRASLKTRERETCISMPEGKIPEMRLTFSRFLHAVTLECNLSTSSFDLVRFGRFLRSHSPRAYKFFVPTWKPWQGKRSGEDRCLPFRTNRVWHRTFLGSTKTLEHSKFLQTEPIHRETTTRSTTG